VSGLTLVVYLVGPRIQDLATHLDQLIQPTLAPPQGQKPPPPTPTPEPLSYWENVPPTIWWRDPEPTGWPNPYYPPWAHDHWPEETDKWTVFR
jgi:hypothetical protein